MPNFSDARLQLRIGALPVLDKTQIILERLFAIALRFPSFAEAFLDTRKIVGIPRRKALRCVSISCEDCNRGVGFTGQIVRATNLRQRTNRAGPTIREAKLLDRLGVTTLGHREQSIDAMLCAFVYSAFDATAELFERLDEGPRSAGPRWQHRQLSSSTGYAGQNEPVIHFGLGSASADSLLVRWPSGRVDAYGPLAVRRVYRVTKAAAC